MLKFKITKHGMAKYSSSALSVDPQVPLLFHSFKKLLAVINQSFIISKTNSIISAISILRRHSHGYGQLFPMKPKFASIRPQGLEDV
jgi:hypothetical protein